MPQALRIIQQPAQLVCDECDLGAFHSRPRFEKNIGIALFLPSNRIQNHHRQPAGHRLGCRHAAGLAEQNRGDGHEIRHVFCVAEHPEIRWAILQQLDDFILHFLVFSTDNDGLKIALHLKQLPHDSGRRTHSQRTACDKDSRPPRLQTVPLEHRIDIHWRSELRLHGNASHLNAVGGQTKSLHMNFVVLLRHKIPVEGPRDPEGVEMKIRDHHPQPRIEFSVRNEPRDHTRRHEMGAENDIRPKFPNQVDERQGLGQIDQQAPFVGHPGIIARLIPPAQKLRQHGREFFVEGGVKLLVEDICVVERIIREHLIHITPSPHGARKGIGCFHMTGTHGGR